MFTDSQLFTKLAGLRSNRRRFLAASAALVLAQSLSAGTFGKVVAIGGEASDLALDEARGVLYVSNFTANRIDVVSLSTYAVRTSINVAAQPGSISESIDGHWLLVAHFGNNTAPAGATNALTLIDLTANNSKQTFALATPPLGVAFGIDGKALVVTTQEFLLFDPTVGTAKLINTVSNVAANTLPVAAATTPTAITMASIARSADAKQVYGMAGSASTFTFRYDAIGHGVAPGGVVLASGTIGPRVVSVNQNASLVMVGWQMITSSGVFLNDIPQRTNAAAIGTTVFDDSRGVLYAHMPAAAGEAPTLQILAGDNLTLLQRISLPENTTGKSILSSDSNTMYAVSDSGLLVLPVGALNQAPRVVASISDLVFAGDFCNRGITSQTLTISDPGGNRTPFTITSSTAGVSVTPSSGVTPAAVTVTVDPTAFLASTGTTSVTLTIASAAAVNAIAPVRVLINSRQPDQRGTAIDVPGVLADVVSDPIRNRYYILRQDQNQVLVFDGSNNTNIATFRTFNVPSAMAITLDGKYLLVGHYDSQTLAVFDLDALQAAPYIASDAGAGNTVHSIAVSTKAILAASTDYQSKGHILKIDLNARAASQLPSLGVYQNTVPLDTVVTTSQNASKVLVAGSDGSVYLYDANADTFTVSRQDVKGLSGPYAASPYDQFVVGTYLLNASLVQSGQFETGTGSPSGFVFLNGGAFRTTAPDAVSAGVVQRVDLSSLTGIRPTRMVEAPPLKTPIGANTPSVFTRTLAYVPASGNLVSLTASGFTVLSPDYDTSVAPPTIAAIVSAADSQSPAAPGGLISLYGTQLSPTNLATSELPLPTALANSCLLVNGQPMPMIFVSPNQINAQMPFQAVGNVTVTVYTPGGVSDNYNLVVPPTSPVVFTSGTAGPNTNLPTVVRWENAQLVTNSNPIHHGDTLVLYMTGLGQVTPTVASGAPAPSNPPASSVVTPAVTLGGVVLPVSFAGLTPGQVGLYQVNVQVPSAVPQGLSVPLTVSQGTATTSLSFRVVQ